LALRYPETVYFGYGDPSRNAALKKFSIDPVDLPIPLDTGGLVVDRSLSIETDELLARVLNDRLTCAEALGIRLTKAVQSSRFSDELIPAFEPSWDTWSVQAKATALTSIAFQASPNAQSIYLPRLFQTLDTPTLSEQSLRGLTGSSRKVGVIFYRLPDIETFFARESTRNEPRLSVYWRFERTSGKETGQ
jgi:hypothetical protein